MQQGSPLFLLLLTAVAMIVLVVLPARRAKKAQQELKDRQAQMRPGSKVMTNFGLYGSIVEINNEDQTAQLEIAPGTVVKVHLLSVTTLEEEEQSQASSPEDSSPAS